MELLLPLGLLGLLSILALIIIYIIKPNYQTKHVSTTFVWQLSLRYKKRRPPTNRIRNILLFLCQVLILASMAGVMAFPAFAEHPAADDSEAIYILDSSASMRAVDEDGVSRFARAVQEIKQRSQEKLTLGGRVTVIVAAENPVFLERRATLERAAALTEELDSLVPEDGDVDCSFGTSDLDKALEQCKDVLGENPAARTFLFTDNEYDYLPEQISLVSMREEEEWNAGILNTWAEKEEGYYAVTVQLACYGGIDRQIEVTLKVSVPDVTDPVTLSGLVYCNVNTVKTVVFRVGGGTDADDTVYCPIGDAQKFTAFRSIQVRIDANDSLSLDNVCSIYGGEKEVINVQYASAEPNPFMNTALAIARNALADRYSLRITEVKKGEEPALSGFDFYVFEHNMPATLPTDGVVLLADPDPMWETSLPSDAGFRVERVETGSRQNLFTLGEGSDYEGHPVTRNIIADEIEVTRYCVLTDVDDGFEVLLQCGGDPALMVMNTQESKLAVMSFSVHYSNLSKLVECFMLMYNLFDYYFPAILEGNSLEVGEEFTLGTRGEAITMEDEQRERTVFAADELPRTLTLTRPGSYVFYQYTWMGQECGLTATVYVKTPAAESDLFRRLETLYDPYEGSTRETVYTDLIVYLAALLVALLPLEWWLHTREENL